MQRCLVTLHYIVTTVLFYLDITQHIESASLESFRFDVFMCLDDFCRTFYYQNTSLVLDDW